MLITATETEPRRFGKQVVLGGVLDHLVNRLGGDHVHVLLLGSTNLSRPEVPYRRRVLGKPGALAQGASVLGRTALPMITGRAPVSLQEAVLRTRKLERVLAAALAEIDADLEIWDTVRTGQYAPRIPPGPGTRRVLYADDLFSLRYTNMLREEDFGDAGGQFSRLLPGPARRVLANPTAQRRLLQLERRLVADAELRQPHWFERTLLVSDDETDVLRDRLGDGPAAPEVSTLPPLLPAQPPALNLVNERSSPEFTFIGGFGYAPNRQGLDWFLRTCRQAVLERLPEITINVVGPGTEAGLPSAGPWGSAVRFLGWVDDLDEVLGRSLGLLSPLRSGSGIKLKVLEALSRGLPVVATPAGAQGIARSRQLGGNGILVGSEPVALAEAMTALLDPGTRAGLAAAARRTWNRTYAPAVVEAVYDSCFGLSAATNVRNIAV